FVHPAVSPASVLLFFPNPTAPPEIYTLSLHDALPIWLGRGFAEIETGADEVRTGTGALDLNVALTAAEAGIGGLEFLSGIPGTRSEEHTSELQSLTNLVCRLLLEKKKQLRNRTLPCHC